MVCKQAYAKYEEDFVERVDPNGRKYYWLTGEFVNFADELGKFEVNQNAMHYDGERLYVGTSDRGLLIYHPRDRRWTRLSAGLASQSVTAITNDDRFVYVGTMNGLVRVEKRVIE